MKYFVLILFTLTTIKIQAQVNDCLPPTSQTDLDINNVRATILNGSDMWHDLAYNFGYEVPKGSGKHSLFAGAIWVGGLDQSGQLKLAAQTYRQSGSDFYPGPINQSNMSTSLNVCNDYDRHWKITRQEVLDFINTGITTSVILDWAGNGDPVLNHPQFLAPFHDNNGDGIYNPADGDYPKYDFTGTNCQDVLLGDQTIWWVFNDVGNVHAESGGIPIGLEIQAMAYAYSSYDEAINNATFYQFKIINRSSTTLDSTYIGSWVQVSIGNYIDDYVGCDVFLNLGFGYNDSDDDGITGYGLNPPSVGMKLLKGPSINGVDLPMTNFHYYGHYTSSLGIMPGNSLSYFNLLRSRWSDGTPLTYGGTGYGGTIPTNYAFPDSSDPAHLIPWFDLTDYGNKKFIQSSGPFTFQPGEVQVINSSVVWARADSGGPIASLHKLKAAASTVQNYFDNCFFAVGINENGILDGVNLFPNPSLTGKFNLDNIPAGAQLSLYSLNGKLIYQELINVNSYEFQQKLNKGVYLMKINYKLSTKTMKWVKL